MSLRCSSLAWPLDRETGVKTASSPAAKGLSRVAVRQSQLPRGSRCNLQIRHACWGLWAGPDRLPDQIRVGLAVEHAKQHGWVRVAGEEIGGERLAVVGLGTRGEHVVGLRLDRVVLRLELRAFAGDPVVQLVRHVGEKR